MSLLRDRAIAMRKLEKATEDLLHVVDFVGKRRAPHYVQQVKDNAIAARRNFDRIQKKLHTINNHAFSPRLELIARLMIIFRPEIKKEIEEIVTFT